MNWQIGFGPTRSQGKRLGGPAHRLRSRVALGNCVGTPSMPMRQSCW